IYLSVIRDANRMRRGLAKEGSLKKVQGVDAENDGLLWGLKQLNLSPYAFVAWVFAVTALADIALSIHYGTFWGRRGVISWTQDRRAFIIDFLVCPLIGFFWARTPWLTG